MQRYSVQNSKGPSPLNVSTKFAAFTAVTRVEKSSFAAATPTMFGVSATIVVSIATAVESTISVDSASFCPQAVITPTNTSALIVLLISYVIILDLN
jgi:hypothetical protein